MSNLVKKEKGFTLIEIVLALAIAGLLLVVVFLAVSGAQKSRRDAARKDDLATFVAAIETYAGNANGTLPGDGTVPAGFSRKDPTTGSTYTAASGITAPTSLGVINWKSSAVCSGNVAVASTNTRDYAAVIKTENGGSACLSGN